MTQKVLENDVMVYNMEDNLKIYKKIFLVTVLDKINNDGIENHQISKIANVEKHRNITKWRAIEFFYEIWEN